MTTKVNSKSTLRLSSDPGVPSNKSVCSHEDAAHRVLVRKRAPAPVETAAGEQHFSTLARLENY